MRKIVNYRFTYFPVLGIILGIVSCLLIFKSNYIATILIDLLIPPIFFTLLCRSKKLFLINFIIFILAFIVGYVLVYVFTINYLQLENPDGIYSVYGKVSAITYKEDYNILRLKNVTLEDGTKISNLKIMLRIDSRINVEVGDYVKCFANTKFLYRDFDFSETYYISEGISYSADAVGGVEVISSKKNIFEIVNLYIKNSIFSNMSNEYAGVAYALIVGNCSYIPVKSNELYKVSGLFHIFSVSGMHISFIAHVIQRVSKRLPINRAVVNVFIIIILFVYCGICGFVVCAVRSAIMCTFMLMCDCFGKKYDIINSILISFIVVLFVNPYNLINVGCLLSYTSVIGLVILTNPIKRLLKFLPNFLSESLSMSISATIMSLPITLYVFGSFAPISILYNLIIVPLIYIIFLLLIIFLVLNLAFKKLVLYNVCKWLLNFINWFLINTKPSRFLIEKTVNYYFMFPYYTFVICGSDLTFIKTKLKIIITCLLLALSIVVMII